MYGKDGLAAPILPGGVAAGPSAVGPFGLGLRGVDPWPVDLWSVPGACWDAGRCWSAGPARASVRLGVLRAGSPGLPSVWSRRSLPC